MSKANYRITATRDDVDVDVEVNTASKKFALEAKEQLVKAGWNTKVEMTKEIE